MAQIILNRSFSSPTAFDPTPDPCFAARRVKWLRSFVACDNTRSICELEAPYAELVRDACRQGGLIYDQIWRVDTFGEQHLSSLPSYSLLIVAEIVNHSPLTATEWIAIQQAALPYFQDHDIHPVYSLISTDGQHSMSAFQAASVDVVQQAHQHTNIPFTRIWRSRLILPASTDETQVGMPSGLQS